MTSATRVASGFGFGIRRELGLLQRPVLDAELLALVDRRVGRDGLGAAHHVDGVDVELAGHAGGLLVRAEAEHADAGHQHDCRVRAAHRRAVRRACRGSRRRTRRGTPRAAPQPGDESSTGRGRPAGRRPAAATLVRRKWSGQDVPSAASRGCSLAARKSRTTSASVKCPTCGLSVRASPRITGASAAALIRRSAAGSASKPGSAGAERLGPAALGEEALRRPDDLERVGLALARWSRPSAVTPWPPRMQPMACGFFSAIAAMSRPSWKPGPAPRHPDHAVAEALAGQLLAVGRGGERDARSRGAGGRRAAASTRPCIAVSIDGAAPPRPCRQKSKAATISSSRSTPG